ncbi:response regulator [Mucilaginibacter sp. CAU 1740]|uniref:response regulator n=1 Tax=Mucilaginibacter sp. CAU 1740 TaxID=3140365 RepID=UPI00325BB105
MESKQPTLLIVDDDSRNIFALGLMLKSKGYPSVSATDAKTGIHLLQTSPNVKTVLLDMMMPGMDGYEAISVIKSLSELKELKIIAVTAQAMPGDREKCLAAGADAYISKPVDIDLLLDMLKKIE